MNDGGPAFPQSETANGNPMYAEHGDHSGGMSLRDWFAGQALAGILGDGHSCWDSSVLQGNARQIALRAYEMADAMFEVREGDPGIGGEPERSPTSTRL
jgi:hypothetical protein